MSVNSAFKGFLNRSWVVDLSTATVMLVIFLIASSFTNDGDRDLRSKQVNLIIRQIGHALLLQAGDSTSRVLPVIEIKEGIFRLEFENAFIFNHDSLMALAQAFLPKKQFPSGYTVTVHDCVKSLIVYGFQVNNASPGILPCRGRSQPQGCYTVEIAFPNLYANVERKKANIDQLRKEFKPSKVDREESKSFKVDHPEVDSKVEEKKSFAVDRQDANPKIEQSQTTTFDYTLINLFYSSILVLVGAALLIGRFRKNRMPVSGQNQRDDETFETSTPKLASLGKFFFDVKEQRLLMGSEVIKLTDKECRILELLNKRFGQLIPRETLMQEVWINEGVITGRSLDMFVSKLRKKLGSDPDLRISNVHGKGYKLEICEIQIL